MQRMAVFVALTVAVGMVLGTVGSPVLNAEPQKRGRTTVERAIRDTDIAFSKAGAAKDLERFLAFYAQDASVFPPNLPLATGKEAIRTFLSQLLANPGFAISWQPTRVEVSRGGDLGYTMGTYALTLHDPTGKPVTDHGKYVTVWRKRPDRTWKAVADIFNSDLPSPAAATR